MRRHLQNHSTAHKEPALKHWSARAEVSETGPPRFIQHGLDCIDLEDVYGAHGLPDRTQARSDRDSESLKKS